MVVWNVGSYGIVSSGGSPFSQGLMQDEAMSLMEISNIIYGIGMMLPDEEHPHTTLLSAYERFIELHYSEYHNKEMTYEEIIK